LRQVEEERNKAFVQRDSVRYFIYASHIGELPKLCVKIRPDS